MSASLGEMLEHVLTGEPGLEGELDAVFRQADALRRRRTRLLLAAGAVIAGTIVLAGYLLTTTLLPVRSVSRAAPAAPATAVPVPSAIADPVLAVLAPMVDAQHLRIVPRPPQRGYGWRQYSILAADGTPRGTVEVAVYARPDGLCFPRHHDHPGCARAEHAGGLTYVRYDDAADPDWQVNQTIARRTSDGRTVALMATGEREGLPAADGRPALTGSEIQRLATDPRLPAAFQAGEHCDGPAADACPVFEVPVPSA